MLRIAEHFAATDLGRQRHGNEDNLFVRAPLFVVADGMGGAQAGEVASEMAVQTFDRGLPDGAPGEALTRVIVEANRAIHERSRSDRRTAGMGTTVTAAYAAESEVVVAHVGDSRAYLLRGGELTRLTRDHSLVHELIEQGRLTEEEAETHPQRSVITRVLGNEPDVVVDVDVFPARAGDVFLLCSDGLTSMVAESRLMDIVSRADSLERAGQDLIRAANEAGGRDNITVVLFRLESISVPGEEDAAGKTTEHRAVDAPTAEHRSVATATAVRAQPQARRADPPDPPEPPPRHRQEPRRRRHRRWLAPLVALAFLLTPVLIGGWIASRAVYFVGLDANRTVTIYRGLPYELPLGISLYERYAGSGVTLEQIPAARRAVFTAHDLRSRDDAENLVIELERGRLES